MDFRRMQTTPHTASCHIRLGITAEPATRAAWRAPESQETHAPQGPDRRCRHKTAASLCAVKLRKSVGTPCSNYCKLAADRLEPATFETLLSVFPHRFILHSTNEVVLRC